MTNLGCTAEPCPLLLNSTCVFYTGANLLYTGITTNNNLQTALEKIDLKFKDASVGYAFFNGVTQVSPGDPVGLGGSLDDDTTINSAGYRLSLTGELEAGKFITTGGTSSQFVKGNGSLDSTTYQVAGNYITGLTGDGSASGPGNAVFTLANVFGSPSTYGSATRIPIITVNAKGLVTNVTTALVNTPAQSVSLSGDVYGSGLTGTTITLTINNVNPNVYVTKTPLKFSVNNRGLITSAGALTNLDIDGIYGYTPVPPTRTLTINGVTYDLSANRSWTVGGGGGSLPSQPGNAGKYLTTDGTNASWAALATGGTVTSVGVNSGTGILATVTNPTTTPVITITNTDPDQTVVLNNGTGIGIVGPYPTFTITNSAPDRIVTLSDGGGINITGSYPNFTIGATGFGTLTTTGNSGPSTYTPGVNLNIPNYTLAGLGGVSSSYFSGTSPIVYNSGTGVISHSTADGNLHVPATGTSNNGKFLVAGATAGSFAWTTYAPTLQNVITNGRALTNNNNFQGSNSGTGATGTNINAFGQNAGASSTGSDVNYFGNGAGNGNTFTYVNLFGPSAQADDDSQTVFTSRSGNLLRLDYNGLTGTRKHTLPNATGTYVLQVNGVPPDNTGNITIPTGGVTSVSAGTGMSFTTITGSGSVAINTSRVPFLSGGFSTGFLRWNGTLWAFDNSTYLTTITSGQITTALGYTPVTNARTITINGSTFDLTSNRTWSVGTVTSVGLSMPAAFTVSSSPVTGSGTISVAANGTASQYIRGDGTLGTLPTLPPGPSGGVNSLNGLTASTQYFQTGTAGTDFGISSSVDTHTFNLPVASATNTGKLSSTDWSTFNNKIGRVISSPTTNTSAGSAAGTDYVYLATNTITITLPTAVGNQNQYTIKNIGTGVISIATTSSQTIEGSASPITINVQYVSLTLVSNGANWFII